MQLPDTRMQAPSATSLNETPLCRWLFGAFPSSRLLADELGFAPGCCPLFEVPTTSLIPDARGPGDIDVLVSSAKRPEAAIAFEAKRVKISAGAFDTGLPGKLSDLRHGVQQANLLHALGFHRSYLLVIIVTDGRQRADFNFASRGPTSELVSIVDGFRDRDRLDPHVGIAFIEVTQPVDREIESAGAIGVRVARDAVKLPQPVTLTNAVGELFRRVIEPPIGNLLSERTF